jgi:RNA recognition motif-containing protein
MSSEYSPSGPRRSSRRNSSGGRRPGRGPRSPRTSSQEDSPKKEPSLLQKIVGFITGKKPAPERPARVEREQRSSSEPRSSERAPRERSAREGRPVGMRSPEVVEVTSPRLYVGNLSFDAAESDLFDLFNGVGSVQNVEIVVNRHTMRSKGFAFVQMQSVDEAKRAVSELHDKDFMGRKLVVSGAKALEERRSERAQESAPEAPAQPVAAAE